MVSDDVEGNMGDDETERNIQNTRIYSITNCSKDVNNRQGSNESVTMWDIGFTILSIVIHMFHALLGLSLCARYFIVNQISHFYCTTAFIFIPSMVIIAISLRMYNYDIEKYPDTETYRRKSFASKVIRSKIWYIFIVIFQLAPVFRLIDSLIYGRKSQICKKQGDPMNQQRYYLKMVKEDQDIALLRVFECFLEAAPLMSLQLTIMLYNYDPTFTWELIHQGTSVGISMVSMGCAVVSYNRGIRLAQWNKSNIGTGGLILQFLWHFSIAVSRILAISSAASISIPYTLIGCLVHWLLMTIWLLVEDSGPKEFCRNRKHAPHTPLSLPERIRSVMFASVIGIVHIFIYVNPTEGSTLLRHTLYYALCILENAIVSGMWSWYVMDKVIHCWYFESLSKLIIFPYIFGIVYMCVFYKYYHPETRPGRCYIEENNDSNDS